MNRTNRALNRIVLFISGALFFAVGAILVTILVWPVGAGYWAQAIEAGKNWLDEVIPATTIGESSNSWVTMAGLALLVILMILLVVALGRVDGHRSRTVLCSTGAPHPLGRITVHESFVSDAIKDCLNQHDEILSSTVTANNVRKTQVMHVSVTPRQNTSPAQLLADVDLLTTNLTTLTGQNVATYISIHSGLRAKLAHDQRRVL